MSTATPLLDNPEFLGDLRGDMTGADIARKWGCSETTAKKWRRRLDDDEPVADMSDMLAGRAENVGPDGGEFVDVKTTTKLGDDWSEIFRRFDLDPTVFEIVGDTVRMSTWQQSKGLEDGSRDVVNLFSYRAQFRRKTAATITKADIDGHVQRARAWTIPTKPAKRKGVPVAAILNLADMQLFKRDGGGHKATLERLQTAMWRFRDDIERHRTTGMNLNELVIVNNGDPFEGIAGNYANQNHTVEGGLRAQMNTVLDVWLMFCRELFPLFRHRQFVSVLCNHTQFGRQGGAKDAITGDEDNGSAFLAETLQRILHATPGFGDVRFTIPHDQMNVYTEAAGIRLGFNHGHKIPGADASGFEKWLNGIARAEREAYDVRVWVTAHRHNFQLFDLGSASVLQCPSCDGGSKWLTDTTGKHSNPGVAAILVGEHHRLGWSDVAFL